MSTARERFMALAREQMTPRAMFGAGFLVVVIALVGYSSLASRVAERAERLYEVERDLALQTSLSQGVDWVERAATARSYLDETQGKFWRGTTAGIVSAQLQGVIENAATSAGLQRVRVSIVPEPEPLTDGVSVFEISVTATDRNGQFLTFLQLISTTDSTLIPVSLDWSRANGATRLTLNAPAIIGTRPAANGDAS